MNVLKQKYKQYLLIILFFNSFICNEILSATSNSSSTSSPKLGNIKVGMNSDIFAGNYPNATEESKIEEKRLDTCDKNCFKVYLDNSENGEKDIERDFLFSDEEPSQIPTPNLGNIKVGMNSDIFAGNYPNATEESKIEEKRLDTCDKDCFEVALAGGKVGISLRNRTETFFSRGVKLLNSSPLDQVIFLQTTWDLKTYANFDVIKSLFVLRNKSRWGNPNSIAQTSENNIKITDVVTGEHKHFLGKQIFWMREGWIEIFLNKAFSIESSSGHSLRLGTFAFDLGRGISLGSAYSVTPGLLGFYTNIIIDQYAPGCLWEGGIVPDRLFYALYIGILSNLSDSFDNVNERIFANIIGRREDPVRGFGKLDFVVASKLDWYISPFYSCNDELNIEPYIMYNRDPEQKVDFPSDAHSDLATLGIDIEYDGSKIEFGFECAKNFGSQKVRGLDRNREVFENRDGNLLVVYSHVLDSAGKKALVTKTNKEVINNAPQSAAFNGQEIGSSGLFNDKTRFRNPYKNEYKGFMMVGDVAYKFTKNFRVAVTGAFASGDQNPNKDLFANADSQVDTDFGGFIGLQEIYSGKRVKSLFIVGSNRIARPLSQPSEEITLKDRFSSNVIGFTNLIYTGIGLDWTTKSFISEKDIYLQPNILAYWQAAPSNKFDIKTKKTLNEHASKFLGVELNSWFEIKLSKNLKGFFISGVFIPGKHFDDVKGKPLNRDQAELLNLPNSTGFPEKHVLTLSNKTAWIINFGFDFSF